MIKIIKKPNGNYALLRWEDLDENGEPTGTYSEYTDAPEEYRPEWVEDHGTVIVALGATGTEDTWLGPDGKAGIREHTKVLNTRFFDLPAHVEVYCWEPKSGDRASWPQKKEVSVSKGGANRRVRGAKYYLDDFAVDAGTVPISGAKVHWWITEDSPQRANIHPHAIDRGYVSTVYDNELYNVKVGPAPEARQRYHSFGILREKVWRNVTIVVEADRFEKGKVLGVYPNSARSGLLYAGGDLPWEQWGSEFIADMPEEIKKAIEAVGVEDEDDDKSIADRLKPFIARMRSTQFRVDGRGKELADVNARGGVPRRKVSTKKRENGGRSGDRPDSVAAKQHAGKTTPNGSQRVVPVNPKIDFPHVEWVSIANGKRAEGELESRAAEYNANTHTILINGDFHIFRQVVEHWVSLHGALPGVEPIVQKAVREVYGMELASRVMHSRTVEGTEFWKAEEFEKMLSPEAMTLAVMGLAGAEAQIAPKIGGSLGAAAKLRRPTTT